MAVRAAEQFKPDLIVMDVEPGGEIGATEASGLIGSRNDMPYVEEHSGASVQESKQIGFAFWQVMGSV